MIDSRTDTRTDAPTEALFQLVFHGECRQGQDAQAVRAAVAQALKLDEARAARLFSGRRVVLRRGLDAATAHRHIARFAAMGAVLHAEPSKLRARRAAAHPTAPHASSADRGRQRPSGWRPLRWAGQTVLLTGLGLGLGLAFGMLFGPGLDALWPDATVTTATDAPTSPTSPAPAAPGATARLSEAPVLPPLAAQALLVAGASPPPTSGTPPNSDTQAPQDISPAALLEHRQRYLVSPQHRAFAIAAARAHGWHAGAQSEDDARAAALAACLAALGSREGSCRIVDVNGHWE